MEKVLIRTDQFSRELLEKMHQDKLKNESARPKQKRKGA